MTRTEESGPAAVFATPDGDVYRIPLVCGYDAGDHITGLIRHRGGLHVPETLPGFLYYATEPVPDLPSAATLRHMVTG
ncbi:DUF6253 family protein [Streptomyces sp. BI20]|uniref:DUF6253 family protein n=1 Tax=Streptomyces sp. BI20 TaxID=3403460 RepID=UPI003C70B9AB